MSRSTSAAVARGPSRPAESGYNTSESPLAVLYRARTKGDARYLSSDEFEAGERLRSDFTRAMMTPHLGINWEAAGMGGGKGRRDGIDSLSDSALSARLRVERALTAVGPELSGVLVDVCCFLKGLKVVETERQWPARSAKLILKTALAALARHYNPRLEETRRRTRHHWGAADYKPVSD